MTDIKHIMFLSRWYPNKTDPMFGLFVKRHAEAVAAKTQVSVAYVHGIKEQEQKYVIEQQQSGSLHEIQVYYRQPKITIPILGKIFQTIRFYSALQKASHQMVLLHGKPDFIHVHILTRLALFALWKKKTQGIRYGITEHWSRYLPLRNEFHGQWRKILTKWVVQQSAFITTASENLALAMQNLGLHHSNYSVLPNVVDTDLFQPMEAKRQNFRFVHISCFEDRSKNISGLLRTIVELKKIRTDFEFVMIGEGIDDAMIRATAQLLGLQAPELRFTGMLQGKTLASTLADADALVLFSNYENLPVVIPEAMSCGLPIIATRVGGISELVNGENGLLVAPGDEVALLDALQKMILLKPTFNKRVIRNTVVNQNSKKAVAEFLWKLYNSALTS